MAVSYTHLDVYKRQDLNNKDLEIFGVVNKSDVIAVNFFDNPNVPQNIRCLLYTSPEVIFLMRIERIRQPWQEWR